MEMGSVHDIPNERFSGALGKVMVERRLTNTDIANIIGCHPVSVNRKLNSHQGRFKNADRDKILEALDISEEEMVELANDADDYDGTVKRGIPASDDEIELRRTVMRKMVIDRMSAYAIAKELNISARKVGDIRSKCLEGKSCVPEFKVADFKAMLMPSLARHIIYGDDYDPAFPEPAGAQEAL
jgi:predicted transcriptional regulator